MKAETAFETGSKEEEHNEIAALLGNPKKTRTVTVRASQGEPWKKGTVRRCRRWLLPCWVYVHSVETLPSGKLRVTIEDVA